MSSDNAIDFTPVETAEQTEIEALKQELSDVQQLNCLLGFALLRGENHSINIIDAAEGARIEIETTNPTRTGKVLIECRRSDNDPVADAVAQHAQGMSK